MAGTNGQAYKPTTSYLDNPEVLVKGDPSTPVGEGAPLSAPPKAKRNIALDLLPFTAVPFEGEDALWAWGRLLMYSGIAYATYKPMRNVSYGAMACAAMSLLTSLSKR